MAVRSDRCLRASIKGAAHPVRPSVVVAGLCRQLGGHARPFPDVILCNNKDDNCDGDVDEGFVDWDSAPGGPGHEGCDGRDNNSIADCLDNCPAVDNEDQADSDLSVSVVDDFESEALGLWTHVDATNGVAGGCIINPGPGCWEAAVVTDALDGSFSARLLADSTASRPPYNVIAAISSPTSTRTFRRSMVTPFRVT